MRIGDFFYMQKSDRRVVLVLLGVAVVAMGLIQLIDMLEPPGQLEVEADSVAVGNVMAVEGRQDRQPYYDAGSPRPERFPFDPNTADSTQLLRLGLQPWQVRNIYKYRARGGIYRRKEDFARLYGLTVKQYRELEPYISISPDYLPASTLFEGRHADAAQTQSADSTAPVPSASRYPVKLKPGETVDLATADTTQLRRVPGIGSYYARRIVAYGERLGGYVSTGQLQEIEDFPADALPFFIVGTTSVHRMNVNRLSLSELRRHPYIDYYQARAIVDYRRLHGPIRSLNDLRLLPEFTPEKIDRLLPYVEY
ncbi:MAG: helix-hairpin-helix domain-containing protein [Prevotella sp.]|nr:helix-hairpin-helix domain-containing protein [Prevotella sp.]